MPVSVRDIAWVAGIVEGEGCLNAGFKHPRWSPHMAIVMTDEDVLQKLAGILSTKVTGPYKYTRNRKPFYRVEISGRKALAWMLTLYTFFGTRRREKVREILTRFKNTASHSRQYHIYN
jgi:hypothetical protein